MSFTPLGLTRLCCLSLACSLGFTVSSWAFIIDPGATPWLTTASGSRTANGQPATLTWGFVPDGTTILNGLTSLGGSDLIAGLNSDFSGDPLETDYTLQPWFGYFEDSFGRWSDLSGLTYEYEPNDTGQSLSTISGVKNVRADIRIGGAAIDGSSGTLAFNYFPDNGDMALDTDDMGFFANPVRENVQIRNTIMHEAGHGLGINHVNSDTDTLLMQPFISIQIDGPQLDEVRAAHFYYGDVNEKSNGGLGNSSAALATPLGTIPDGTTASIGTDADITNQSIGADDTDFVSLSNDNDTDFFSFLVTEASTVDLLLKPLGGQFTQASQGATPTPFDASARADLTLNLWDDDGLTLITSANLLPAGGIESILGVALPTAGTYYASITTTTDTVQLYRLDISADSIPAIIGDIDGDGFVGVEDLNLVLSNWNATVTPGDLLAGDPSGDSFVGIDDLNTVLGNWNVGTPPPPDVASLIPEPTSSGILALLSLVMYGRPSRCGVVE
jgi:serralysin